MPTPVRFSGLVPASVHEHIANRQREIDWAAYQELLERNRRARMEVVAETFRRIGNSGGMWSHEIVWEPDLDIPEKNINQLVAEQLEREERNGTDSACATGAVSVVDVVASSSLR